MVRKITALLLSLLMLAIPCLLNAQSSTEIIKQARIDASKDISGCAWIALGFFFNLFAVGAAYILGSNPPASRLMGKSPEYVQVYILAYRRQARSRRVTNSLIGCAAVIAVEAVVILIATRGSD